MKVQQKRYWNLNIYLKTLFYFIFNLSVYPLISSTKSGPLPELEGLNGYRPEPTQPPLLVPAVASPDRAASASPGLQAALSNHCESSTAVTASPCVSGESLQQRHCYSWVNLGLFKSDFWLGIRLKNYVVQFLTEFLFFWTRELGKQPNFLRDRW